MSMKVYEPLPKTNTIFLGEVNVFQGIGGKPADNDYYQEIVKEYLTTLEEELVKNGFVVVKKETAQLLVIKTKIGYRLPPLGESLGGMGAVGAQVEVYQNGKLLLYFEETVNIFNPAFEGGGVLRFRAKDRIERHIVPRIAGQLKKKFL